MIGAILGDIAGSRFEFSKPEGFNAKTVSLFADNCFYTDDSVMTIATKYAVLNNTSYRVAYADFGKKYPLAGYGTMFKQWIEDFTHQPYHSFGNGSAMRVSFIGEYFSTIERVREEARKSAMCTHNHPEGIKGAEATAACVYLAKHGHSKRQIKRYVERNFGYRLNRPLFLTRPFSKFDITCQVSVPLAIRCFLESESWEDCIRKVFSITCDTDTIGCIAGGIAEAFYRGTGQNDKELLMKYLAKPGANGKRHLFLYEWAVKEY